MFDVCRSVDRTSSLF